MVAYQAVVLELEGVTWRWVRSAFEARSVKSETFGNIAIFEVEPHGASEAAYLGFYLSDLIHEIGVINSGMQIKSGAGFLKSES